MNFEELMTDYVRRGEREKANYFLSLEKSMLPSHLKRVESGDRSVLKETVVPKWVSWEMLQEWVKYKKSAGGKRCALCELTAENGIEFMNKFLCDNCFLSIKNRA
ncbi:MAG: hypothetical protein HY917_02305 [Candidatus Diapherotrites archaeon]|nr:hypothetical protein [Candidatus Diapherotrites archaeon]